MELITELPHSTSRRGLVGTPKEVEVVSEQDVISLHRSLRDTCYWRSFSDISISELSEKGSDE